MSGNVPLSNGDHHGASNGNHKNGTSTDSNTLLVTGGAGFIGSHTVLELLNLGYNIVVIDNCVNAQKLPNNNMPESLRRVQELTGRKVTFYLTDLTDMDAVKPIFEKHRFLCIIHFAGLKAVNESVLYPLLYYQTNLIGTLNLLQCMVDFNISNIIFSSSATVYGFPDSLPITEAHPVGKCTNAYGKTKYFIEEFLKDQAIADPSFNAVILRYFNPIGAHESGRIGEDPSGVPNNLMPYVAQVASGKLKQLSVFGSDYDTKDGTGVRDYIHVVDLALGHTAALEKLIQGSIHGLKVYNLGTGKGYSVLEMVAAMEKASGREIPYVLKDRREGDVGEVYADCSLAAKELDWTAERGMETMCRDLWNWQNQNKNGYQHDV
ncbi:UDP-glucose 4-epimerase-like isoform X2 [Convolutriloba macropyga]|uniref:UDP-glucose 4-epimerase-like isoform X2 n=1 Tax=Convolutriloba macropyga TaxID=536237 RepID=UPI003F5238B6